VLTKCENIGAPIFGVTRSSPHVRRDPRRSIAVERTTTPARLFPANPAPIKDGGGLSGARTELPGRGNR
jgi:hypothetical protein